MMMLLMIINIYDELSGLLHVFLAALLKLRYYDQDNKRILILDMENIKAQFNSVSKRYDGQRKFLIPRLDDFYTCCTPIIKHSALQNEYWILEQEQDFSLNIFISKGTTFISP